MKFDDELLKVLTPYKQWVLYDKEKKPFQVGTGHFAKVNDPGTWTTYDKVKNEKRRGFVLTATDPFVVMDIDHCVSGLGQVGRETTAKILYFQSYTELSPSGKGLHIWMRGKLPSAIKRRDFELYGSGRYITVTGNSLFNCSLSNCQLQLDRIYEKYGQPNLAEIPEAVEPIECKNELRALYKKSEPFRTLWRLEPDFRKADGSPDWSSFDMSLASLLWAWPSGKIAWAINFFREQHGAKVKHRGAIDLTIAKVKNSS